MTNSALVDGSYQRSYLLTIDEEGAATGVEFAGKTNEVEFPEWVKNVEYEVMDDSSMKAKYVPSEAGEIKLSVMTGDLSDWNIFGGDAATGELSLVRKKYRLAFLWTTDADAAAGAGATTDATSSSLRHVYVECYCTKHKVMWEDKVRKCEFTFKVSPFDDAKASNITKTSDTAATILALATY